MLKISLGLLVRRHLACVFRVRVSVFAVFLWGLRSGPISLLAFSISMRYVCFKVCWNGRCATVVIVRWNIWLFVSLCRGFLKLSSCSWQTLCLWFVMTHQIIRRSSVTSFGYWRFLFDLNCDGILICRNKIVATTHKVDWCMLMLLECNFLWGLLAISVF